MKIEVVKMQKFINYFYEKYCKRSLAERIELANNYYRKLRNLVDSKML